MPNLRFNGNVKYNIKMTTLHDRITKTYELSLRRNKEYMMLKGYQRYQDYTLVRQTRVIYQIRLFVTSNKTISTYLNQSYDHPKI